MKKFAFVSDFDGTLSNRDFYHIVIDKYLGQSGRDFYENWKKNNRINVEFLNKIFSSIHRSEQEIRQDILEIPLDDYVLDFIKLVQNAGGDFYILSAGTSYYINILLAELGVKNVTVVSMEGEYYDGGIRIIPDNESPYYSEVFGIDKGKFISSIKKNYNKVYFAGDSEPDITAAKNADFAFAKGELIEHLKKDGCEFLGVKSFLEIKSYLDDKGVLKCYQIN
jgi:2,3-diketo-5-methylthio-1-phosphopentane phosphatase